jgi:hypothetical protein
MALFKVGVAGTYSGLDQLHRHDRQLGRDEPAPATPPAAHALTNVDPVASSPSAYTDFSPDPSWTSASFSTIGCMIYNTIRNGDTANAGHLGARLRRHADGRLWHLHGDPAAAGGRHRDPANQLNAD